MVKYKNNILSFFIIACLWFAAFASLYSDAWNSVALYVVLPAAFVMSFVRNGFKLATNKYMSILIALYLWCLFACVWATYTDLALQQMRQILGAFLISYIFAVNAKDEKLVPWLYASYIVLFASACLYARSHILMDSGTDNFRLNDEKLNANTMAYYLFYVTFIVYEFGEIVNKPSYKKLWRFCFWLMLPLTFTTAMLTASRQVLIIQIPLIAFLLYLRYFNKRGLGKKMVFVILILAGIVALLPSIMETYNASYLATRSEANIKEDPRTLLLLDAIHVGAEHFPIGVGPGNYIMYSFRKQFSHNTYSELWANVGIVGLFLYCWLMWLFIKRSWQHYKYTHNKAFLVFLLFGVVYSFDGVFYVFYNGVWLMPIFILVATHNETYFKSNTNLLKL